MLDTHLAQYAESSIASDLHPRSLSVEVVKIHHAPEDSHRALRINEILEAILGQATHSTLRNSWNLLMAWRNTVARVLNSQASSPFPCPPVKQYQVIDSHLLWLQPSEQERAYV